MNVDMKKDRKIERQFKKILEKNELMAIKQWEKGRLVLNRDYNAYSAFKYFKRINEYISKYLDLCESDLLPAPYTVDNGKIINDTSTSK